VGAPPPAPSPPSFWATGYARLIFLAQLSRWACSPLDLTSPRCSPSCLHWVLFFLPKLFFCFDRERGRNAPLVVPSPHPCGVPLLDGQAFSVCTRMLSLAGWLPAPFAPQMPKTLFFPPSFPRSPGRGFLDQAAPGVSPTIHVWFNAASFFSPMVGSPPVSTPPAY